MRSRWSRRAMMTAGTALVALGAVIGWAPLASAGPVGAATGTGQVWFVQALAGTTVTVAVDGSVIEPAAAPKAVIGPLSLAAGQHVVRVSTGSADLVSARFSVAAEDSLDLVAHRAADTAGSPVVTVFTNDLSAVRPGKTRLVVSHVAVAGPADIRVDGRPYFRNVADGESLSLVVPARTYSLDVVATAGGRTILAPVRTTLGAGTLTRVFALGDPDRRTTDAIVQVIRVPTVGAGTPTSVHTGDGGQAAESIVAERQVPWSLVAAGIGLLGAAMIAGAAGGSMRSLQATGVRRPR